MVISLVSDLTAGGDSIDVGVTSPAASATTISNTDVILCGYGANTDMTTITFGDFVSHVNHDSLDGYVANEHINLTDNSHTGIVNYTGDLFLSAAANETRAIEVGYGRTQDGISLVDLTSEGGQTDYNLRIMSNPGAAADALIINKSGDLYLRANNTAKVIRLQVGVVDRLVINTEGIDIKGSITRHVRGTGADTTITDTDDVLTTNASVNPITVDLPALTSVPIGRQYTIKRLSGGAGNTVTVDAGTDTIDGSTSITLLEGECVTLVRITALWLITNSYTP